MKTEFCVFCGSSINLEHHHVLPRVLGGNDEEENMLTCCSLCHGKLHDLKRKYNHGELTKLGLQKARERGVKLGGTRRNMTEEIRSKGREASRKTLKVQRVERWSKVLPLINKLQTEGLSLRSIAKELTNLEVPTARGGEWSATMVSKILTQCTT
jgi:hypothetical protein